MSVWDESADSEGEIIAASYDGQHPFCGFVVFACLDAQFCVYTFEIIFVV